MTLPPAFVATAALLGDPARAAMLTALIDGRALSAGELAHAGGVALPTASGHLARLTDGGLLTCERQGRHRYYRLAGPAVAEAMERLAALTPARTARPRPMTAEAKRLRAARRCYDHLAGQLGVAVTRALLERGVIEDAGEQRFAVSVAGADWFRGFGIDPAALKRSPRGIARPCLDWTEREHHLGGPLGVALLGELTRRGWLLRSDRDRCLAVTPAGRLGLRQLLGVDG